MIKIAWNNTTLHASPGDTVAAALYRHGIVSIASTRKLHEPMGYSGSYVGGVLARVDGQPNVRLDQQPVRDGMRVESQNRWPGASCDLLSLARFLPPRWVYGGFEHGRFTPRHGRAYLLWERLLAHLAGVGRPPPRPRSASERPARKLGVDVLVAGGGPAGQKAANDIARTGRRVALVSRGTTLGRYAQAMGVTPLALHKDIIVLSGMELCGSYRRGSLMIAAPMEYESGAVAIEAESLVLATGKSSMPPMVRNSHLPGVMDAHTALLLGHFHAVPAGKAIAVVGTGAETMVAQRLALLGSTVVYCGHVSELTCIHGHSRITGIDIGNRRIRCDAMVHAGAWRSDPSLAFQTGAEGVLQVSDVMSVDADTSCVGFCHEPDQDIHVPDRMDPAVRICPCMDVTAGEVTDLIDRAVTDPEILKRLTSCGMGPCQGFPCWESMLALLAKRTGQPVDSLVRPSHRPPRRALTVAQAAGLCDVVQPL
ncbi:sarcosine oxidase subunit alpha [Komagataeibacter diospyri]|uniref:2Fe-2S iron-sulfur cluster-binding protein n=1 Tax=Komagataeibacter diospyri TaxID=1932662 RepID=UPI00113B0632|nr:2Fe-2S iron-sulfur cluster-binding protein [Komagataeibacter diospyri]GCE88922.1 sarcosine oxidase subunit alpha [Komagataeibacter diospyri]